MNTKKSIFQIDTTDIVLQSLLILGNIVSATRMFLDLLENIFPSREANFVSGAMFLGVGGQTGKH